MPRLSSEILEKLKHIRLLVLDSDGVFTDGGVYITDGGQEMRRFDIKDGAGLKAVMTMGIKIAVISSGKSLAVQHRCRQLGIDEVHVAVEDKLACLRQICEHYSVSLEQVCYVGDDLVDLPVMAAVGVSCATADAAEEVSAMATVVLSRLGGHGAVREVCDVISSC